MKIVGKLTLITLIILLYTSSVYSQKFHSGHEGHGKQESSKLNYDSLFTEAIPLSKSVEGQALIENCINKYGGEETLSKLNNYQLRYSMMPMMSSDSVNVIKSFDRNYKYKIVKEDSQKNETRIFNGASAWFENTDTVMVIDSGRYKSEYFSFLTLSMPFGMKNIEFNQIRYGVRDEDPLSYIYMEKSDTLMIILGIDPTDHFIKSSEGIVYQGENNFVFINKFDDFKKVNGYYFPFDLINISMGLEVARSRLSEVIVNGDIKENYFRPVIRNKSKSY